MPAAGALNVYGHRAGRGFCVIVFDTLLQLELNTLLPLAKSNMPAKLPVVIVSVIVKTLFPAGTVTDTQ